MAQNTFVDGDVLTAAEINTYLMGEGGAWTSWTPTVTQSGSVTVTNTRSRYARYGRTIHFSLSLSVTGSGTGNNAIIVSVPVTAASTSSPPSSSGQIYDASSGTYYPCTVSFASTTSVGLNDSALATGSPSLGVTGSSFNAGLASGDLITVSGTYEAAS